MNGSAVPGNVVLAASHALNAWIASVRGVTRLERCAKGASRAYMPVRMGAARDAATQIIPSTA